MWKIWTGGFVSIVEKPEDRGTTKLTVRSRDRKSLLNFCELAGIPKSRVKRHQVTDYQYRLRCEREAIMRFDAAVLEGVHYDNFKNAAKAARGTVFANALGRTWSALWSLAPAGARYRAPTVVHSRGEGSDYSRAVPELEPADEHECDECGFDLGECQCLDGEYQDIESMTDDEWNAYCKAYGF